MSDRYEIQIQDHLDLDWDEWFTGFTFTHQPDGTTLLRGPVSDQPALHGLLKQIDQLGWTLLRVERVETEHQNDE